MIDKLKAASTIVLFLTFAALVVMTIVILYYPQGQAYLRCEKNAPLINSYDSCTANGSIYTYQCINPKAAYGGWWQAQANNWTKVEINATR